LFSVGNNDYGCIGDDTNDNCKIIKQIEFFKNIFIVDIVCGWNHCLSISNKGEIFGWGDNKYNQINNEKESNQYTPIIIFKIKKI
jgi:alpha-tubulin suppressor-like RCC1 family protein